MLSKVLILILMSPPAFAMDSAKCRDPNTTTVNAVLGKLPVAKKLSTGERNIILTNVSLFYHARNAATRAVNLVKSKCDLASYNGPGDALRHFSLAVFLTLLVGKDDSFKLLEAHEVYGAHRPQPVMDSLMDYKNNNEGIGFALEYMRRTGSKEISDDQVFQAFKTRLEGGKFRLLEGAPTCNPEIFYREELKKKARAAVIQEHKNKILARDRAFKGELNKMCTIAEEMSSRLISSGADGTLESIPMSTRPVPAVPITTIPLE